MYTLIHLVLYTCISVLKLHYYKNIDVLYIKMLKALYRMLTATILYHKKNVHNFKTIRFKLNLYDPYNANLIVKNKQHTSTWHVNNFKSSHVDLTINDDFYAWLSTNMEAMKLER